MITFDFIRMAAIMLCILVCITIYVIKELSYIDKKIEDCKAMQEYCEEQLLELKEEVT